VGRGDKTEFGFRDRKDEGLSQVGQKCIRPNFAMVPIESLRRSNGPSVGRCHLLFIPEWFEVKAAGQSDSLTI
jgi:hypothetical protein